MATYVVPQALVYQEISDIPQADIQPQSACIVGPHAHLIRYAEADEKAFGLLGDYNELVDTAYDWPNRPAGGVIDDSYTKVYIDDALLLYYTDTIGSGDTILTVVGETNQIRAAATLFKSNGAAYPRTAAKFYDRDVAIGDAAKIRAVVGSDEYELCTYVSGFVAEVVAAVVAAATADSANLANDAGNALYAKTAGATNCVDIASADYTLYDGLEDGNVEETYTILCTKSSVGGDATTAELRINSASGNDDVLVVTPSAFGVATAIGARGATATFDNTLGDCSISAANEGVDVDDFVAGQTWQLVASMDFFAPTATSGGAYTGTTDTIYIVRVSKGGYWADSPEITITTDTGVDVSGPTIVTGAATAIPVGTQGVTISFNQLGLSKNDRYYVECQAASEGAIQTLTFGHSFDQDVIDNGATDVDLTLYIRKDIEVSENRTGHAPLVNWEQSATEITINSGIVAFDDSWTNAGVPLELPVVAECGYGQVYVNARYWLADLCSELNQLHDTSAIEASISGPLHPDNPLKWGVFKALQNSNGVAVSYAAVCDPDDVSEWLSVLEILDGDRKVYGLVPLTRNATVWSAYQAHVNAQSSAVFGRWRYLWLNQDEVPEKVIVDDTVSADEAVVMAVLEDDPNTSGTQYTLLRVPAGNSDFVTNGVQAGDIVRYLYEGDGFGNSTYTEFVVDAVVNEDSIRLLTGHTLAVAVAQKVEVWRTLTETEEAAEYALTEGYTDRRVMMTWPHEVGQDGYTVEGYFLNCCLAGLVSGVVPHQGLTNLEISGCDDLSETTRFNRTQLNTMAGGGIWIVTQDPNTGDVFSRHALSTADYDSIDEREEMVTRNLDSMSYYFLDIYSPYIGISNVTESVIDMLRAETHSGIKFLESRYFVQRLGSQLVAGTITRMRRHLTLLDRIVIDIDMTLPYPLNNIECHLKLVA